MSDPESHNKNERSGSRSAHRTSQPLRECVQAALERYFRELGGQRPSQLYDMVINEVEYPLLQTVMAQAEGNQTRAAEILGINRSTLRKKLREHGLA